MNQKDVSPDPSRQVHQDPKANQAEQEGLRPHPASRNSRFGGLLLSLWNGDQNARCTRANRIPCNEHSPRHCGGCSLFRLLSETSGSSKYTTMLLAEPQALFSEEELVQIEELLTNKLNAFKEGNIKLVLEAQASQRIADIAVLSSEDLTEQDILNILQEELAQRFESEQSLLFRLGSKEEAAESIEQAIADSQTLLFGMNKEEIAEVVQEDVANQESLLFGKNKEDVAEVIASSEELLFGKKKEEETVAEAPAPEQVLFADDVSETVADAREEGKEFIKELQQNFEELQNTYSW